MRIRSPRVTDLHGLVQVRTSAFASVWSVRRPDARRTFKGTSGIRQTSPTTSARPTAGSHAPSEIIAPWGRLPDSRREQRLGRASLNPVTTEQFLAHRPEEFAGVAIAPLLRSPLAIESLLAPTPVHTVQPCNHRFTNRILHSNPGGGAGYLDRFL